MTTVNDALKTIQDKQLFRPMSKEQVIKVNTALLVFALSSLGGTIFWGGQIFEKLSRIEKEVQKMDQLYDRVTIIEQKLNAHGFGLLNEDGHKRSEL